jgi:cell division protein FtsZ
VQQAFMVMDQLISEMVKGIIEVITKPSLINLDFADLKTILGHGGISTVLYAENSDPEALVRDALNNPLLEIDIAGATGALVHITGGDNLTLKRVNNIMERINSYMDDSARVIFGAKVDPEFEGNIRMLAVVTGIAELAEDCDRLDIVEDIGEVVNKYST